MLPIACAGGIPRHTGQKGGDLSDIRTATSNLASRVRRGEAGLTSRRPQARRRPLRPLLLSAAILFVTSLPVVAAAQSEAGRHDPEGVKAAPQGASQEPFVAANELELAVDEAIARREFLGLRSDRPFVEQLHRQEASHPATETEEMWGTRLTDAEAAEMQERELAKQQMRAIRAYARSAEAEFGGMFWSHRLGGVITVGFTAHITEHEASLRALTGLGNRLVVKQVPVTERELYATVDRITDDLPTLVGQGFDIQIIYADIRSWRVVVGLSNPSGAALDEIRRRYGFDHIELITAEEPTPNACNTRIDCTPFRSGIEITDDTNGKTGTGAFVAWRGNPRNYFWITAGHMSGQGVVGHAFRHWRNGNPISAGTSTRNAFSAAGGQDVQLVDIPDDLKSRYAYATNTQRSLALTNRLGFDADEVGDDIYMAGITSGRVWGEVWARNLTVGTNPPLQYQRLGTFIGASGDSGAGVYWGTTAVGVHAGLADCNAPGGLCSYYAHLRRVELALQVTVYVSTAT